LKRETNKGDHKDGMPWNSVARFENYHPADIRRQQIIAADPDLQVKVHRAGPEGSYFTVKTRINPELESERRAHHQRKKRKKK
tara:strand:- start:1160 stop:1408 length:249 start_codon:yes stop_codon:yes gene_type:complete